MQITVTTSSADTVELTMPELRDLIGAKTNFEASTILSWLRRAGVAKRVGFTKARYTPYRNAGSSPVVWRLPALITVKFEGPE